MTYLSLQGEVDTFGFAREILKDGKRLVIPKVDVDSQNLLPCEVHNLDDLEPAHYGILEPSQNNLHLVAIETIGLHIVPGIAFDKRGVRLGRGKGYYDRFLARVPPHILTVGVCYECQITDALPRDTWDVPVKCIVTENRILRF